MTEAAPWRVKLVSFGLISALGVVMMGGAELWIRRRQASRYGFRSVEDMFTEDPGLGIRICRPNSTFGHIHINSLGFRGPEIIQPKPTKTVRVAFLGASTTFCAEVSDDQHTWPHEVIQHLKKSHPEVHWDYVNAAQPGYTLANIRKLFDAKVAPLAPDAVIFYEATNDLSQDSAALARAQGLLTEAPETTSWLGQQLVLVGLVEKNLKLQASLNEAEAHDHKLVFTPQQLSAGFAERLDHLVTSAQTHAPYVAVATFAPRLRPELSADDRHQAAVTAAFYMPYMGIDGLLAGYAEYNRVIRHVAQTHQIDCIEGLDEIPPDAVHYTDSVHFTDAGAEKMAQRLASALLSSPRFNALIHQVATATTSN